MIEEWRKVPDVEYLWASSLGRVKSEPYKSPMPNGGFKTNELKPTFGFLQKCTAQYNRKMVVFRRKTYIISTIVAHAFLGLRPVNLVVSHKDENSLNNRIDNLEYVTQKENMNMPKIKEYHRRVCRWKMAA